MHQLKSGDVLQFTQEDGNVITLFVFDEGINVKSNELGTDLSIHSGDSKFFATVKSVKRTGW